MWMEAWETGGAAVREPHRHDYHELIWVRTGSGQHLLDGEPLPVRPHTITLIGRGQVHVFARAREVNGAVVRFGEELLLGGGAQRATPGWLLAGRGGRTVPVPRGEADRLEASIAALDAEARRPPDGETAELERHLVSVLLLWVERWYDAARTEHRDTDDAEVQLHRRFAPLLEERFARHHDAGHYADALGVPPAALSRALTQVTGRSTKDLITDRVMLEAARLLRFTDLTAQEVAQRTGFEDPLYFSRAFKRRFGAAPMAYRGSVRGKSMHS
ncbi:MAG: AraC family transcriptional regulator, transcriptional activator of pobA [Thermoleophilaceae bacterium]|jgi:AraC family transcriptional activator of pobA|nr:AraC family transcriptional regulator, transcriptional activator of pobA [Thermoleophilaceae bacterium]